MSVTTTIRVSVATRNAVNRAREQTGESTDSILEKALAAYEESRFWRRWHEVHGTADNGDNAPVPDDDMRLWDEASRLDLTAAATAADDADPVEARFDP